VAFLGLVSVEREKSAPGICKVVCTCKASCMWACGNTLYVPTCSYDNSVKQKPAAWRQANDRHSIYGTPFHFPVNGWPQKFSFLCRKWWQGWAWATGWTIGILGFNSRQGLRIFLFTPASRTALGPTQPHIQWVAGVPFLGVKRPGREDDHSPPSSAEVKKAWSYTTTPPIRLHGMVLS
jgi:hypothetical protein